MIWVVVLVLAAAGGLAAYRVVSARQEEAYVRAVARDQLLELVAGRTPAEVDEALPRLSLGRGPLTPRARRHVRLRLWPRLAQLLSGEAVKRWRGSAGHAKGRMVFAVHPFMDDFGFSEVIADAQAYDALPAAARRWMNRLDSDAHLRGDMRKSFAEQMAAAGTDCSLQKLGEVDQPVAADIYGVPADEERVGESMPGSETPHPSLQEEWADYRRWLDRNAPEQAASLATGATAQQLADLERQTGVAVSEEFKAFYAIHDGQPWEAGWVFPEGQWMPLEQVLEAYGQCLRDAGPQWERGWIPFVFDGGSSYVCQAQPGGELWVVWFEEEEPEFLASGIAEWLAQLNDQARQGTLRLDPER